MSYVKLDEESTSISSQEVQLPGFKPVTLRLDVAVQHTLHWTAVTREGTTLPVLPAGSCNLYLFPRIALGRGVARKKSASMRPRSGFLNLPRAARTFAHGDREHNGAGRGVADALWHLLTRSLSGVEETLRN